MRKAKPIPTLTDTQIERLKNSFQVNQSTGCWEWNRARNKHGYGVYYVSKDRYLAHRVMYSLYKGQPSVVNHIDHLCRNPRCINPAHLEDVPPAVNIMRGVGFGAVNAAKTHCPRGHLLDGDNTIKSLRTRSKASGRACRACDVAGRKARHKKLTGDFREAFIKREADAYYELYKPLTLEVAA